MAVPQDGHGAGLAPKQKRAAAMLANPAFTGTVSSLCEELGISRTTFGRWLALPQFKSCLERLVSEYTDSALPQVWHALLQKCGEGNLQAIKLYFDLKLKADKAPSPETTIIVSGREEMEEELKRRESG